MARKHWRCFHCGEVYTREVDAAEHFGGLLNSLAGCQIKGHEHSLLAAIREQEAQLMSYRAEDGHMMRAMAAMRGEHSIALRRAEESGYALGLKHAMAPAGSK